MIDFYITKKSQDLSPFIKEDSFIIGVANNNKTIEF